MSNSNERSVKVASVDEVDSKAAVGAGVDHGTVSWEPMKFEQETHSHFHVEYALAGDDFVVHFFVHPDALKYWSEGDLERWWQNDFATTLSNVAQQYFKATQPRIQAKYTVETASWWFKAQGYGHLLAPLDFLRAFFVLLDGSLPTVDGRPPAHAVATASL